MVFKGYNIFGLIAIIFIFKWIYTELKTRPLAICLNFSCILLLLPTVNILWSPNPDVYTRRDYYGIYRVYQKGEKIMLVNGTTLHGAQYLTKAKQMIPLTYYHYSTPVGKVMRAKFFHFKRVGLIGLGTGTLAAYGKPGQVFDFFELDPEVLRIARKYFTYLTNSPSKINYFLGDARISIMNMPRRNYDLLVVDAFSGDAIPVHLLTTEAIAGYLRHMTNQGIILFHISNRYINLRPVLFSNARNLNLYVCYGSNRASGDEDDACSSSWIAITRDKLAFKKLTKGLKMRKNISLGKFRDMRPWTDDYSDVLIVMQFNEILDQVKDFTPFYW
jgi:spermidine synthase